MVTSGHKYSKDGHNGHTKPFMWSQMVYKIFEMDTVRGPNHGPLGSLRPNHYILAIFKFDHSLLVNIDEKYIVVAM